MACSCTAVSHNGYFAAAAAAAATSTPAATTITPSTSTTAASASTAAAAAADRATPMGIGFAGLHDSSHGHSRRGMFLMSAHLPMAHTPAATLIRE